MKIGDLIKVRASADWSTFDDIGIIMHVFSNGDANVLFDDGIYQMDQDDLEVINEPA